MNSLVNKLKQIGIDNNQFNSEITSNSIDINIFEQIIDSIIENQNSKFLQCHDIFDKILNNINESIVITDNSKILFANNSVREKLHLPKSGQISFDDFSLKVCQEDRQSIISAIENIQNNITIKEKIKIRISPDTKKQLWIEMIFSPIEYRNKAAIQVIIENISDKVQTSIQKEIISNMMLDAEKKRFETEKMIERSAKIASVGVIASGITHEINQPLNAIKVGSDGLLIWNMQHPGVFPEKIMKVVNAISISAGKIDNIIKHLRSYWLDDNDMESSPVDVNKVVNNAVLLLGQKLNSHDIELIVDLDDSAPIISANAVDTELIINNLIMNSINNFDKIENKIDKYIRIETINENNNVIIRLSDNGTDSTGITEELLFEPYLYNDLRNTSFGIELAIVKLFIARFNAKIAVAANSDNGTTFSLKFKKKC